MAEEIHMIVAGMLARWNVGRHDLTDDPVLVVEMLDGSKFAVRMPSSAAVEMGHSLVYESGFALAAKRKPNQPAARGSSAPSCESNDRSSRRTPG